jgi:hypothetical protein
MPNQSDSPFNSNLVESPIKHTSGGEMPDPSKVSSIRSKINRRRVEMRDLLIPFAIVGLTVGAYFLLKKQSPDKIQ